jgi:flagellar biosynthesis anti-sigma factor FlgM
MKITGNGPGGIPDPGSVNKKEPANNAAKVANVKANNATSLSKELGVTSQGATVASEKIMVSDVGREIAKIQGQVKKTPDIRSDKVKSIKSQVDSGTYYVSSDKIASKIVEDIVKNG